jgi:hypothetical protein
VTVCHWCREALTFVPGRGWLHPAGNLYLSHVEERPCLRCGRRDADGKGPKGKGCAYCQYRGTVSVTVDDHCALPVPA